MLTLVTNMEQQTDYVADKRFELIEKISFKRHIQGLPLSTLYKTCEKGFYSTFHHSLYAGEF